MQHNGSPGRTMDPKRCILLRFSSGCIESVFFHECCMSESVRNEDGVCDSEAEEQVRR